MTIIDVREPHEWQIANLESFGSRLIPLGQFPDASTNSILKKRSSCIARWAAAARRAYDAMKKAGFTKIKNLKGGILAWADQVDRTMTKY